MACRIFHCGAQGFSLVVVPGLSCPEACGILVPRPGIEPGPPALEGRFLTTGPPGKSHQYYLERVFFCVCITCYRSIGGMKKSQLFFFFMYKH